MKKRVLSLVSAVVCMVLMATTAVAAQADAYALYQTAIKKMEKVTSAQIKGTMKVAISSEVMSMDMTLGFTIKQCVDSNGELEMSMIIDANDWGVQAESYYRGGYLYSNNDGEKTKVKMPAGDAEVGLDFEVPEELFKDATVEAVDGGQRIKVKIPSKYINEIMGGALATTTEPDDDVKLSSVTCYYTVGDNGYIKSQKVSYTMTMTGDVATKAKYTVSMKYSSLNQIHRIEFPTDLSSYKTVKA